MYSRRRGSANETDRGCSEHGGQLPLLTRQIEIFGRVVVQRSFDARCLMKAFDDDRVANDAHRNGGPVGQRRSNAFPGDTMEVGLEHTVGAHGLRAIRMVGILDVHVSTVVAEDQQRENEESEDEQA